jgi:hypothetical protein
MANSLTVKEEYILELTQKTITSHDLKGFNNPVLDRLAKSVEKRNNSIDVTNYSRMHNRHNRS